MNAARSSGGLIRAHSFDTGRDVWSAGRKVTQFRRELVFNYRRRDAAPAVSPRSADLQPWVRGSYVLAGPAETVERRL